MSLRQAEEVYHRAIWALDAAGDRVQQYWLMMRWNHVARVMAVPDIDPTFVAGEVRALQDASKASIHRYGRDSDRSLDNQQRDYLIGIASRCLKALRLRMPKTEPIGWKEKFFRLFKRSALASEITPQEAAYLTQLCETLHYYSPVNESFHADLGIGYYLWQGIRAEMKMGITLARLDGNENSKVTEVAIGLRNILEAMEHSKPELLRHYKKSILVQSDEQYQAALGIAVVEEFSHLLRESGKGDVGRFLA